MFLSSLYQGLLYGAPNVPTGCHHTNTSRKSQLLLRHLYSSKCAPPTYFSNISKLDNLSKNQPLYFEERSLPGKNMYGVTQKYLPIPPPPPFLNLPGEVGKGMCASSHQKAGGSPCTTRGMHRPLGVGTCLRLQRKKTYGLVNI